MTWLLLTQIVGITTGAQFVVALRTYFRRGPARRASALLSATAVLVSAYHLYLLLTADEVPGWRLAAALLAFSLANALFWLAVSAHGTDRPAIVFGRAVPARLVTGGPYRLVRHPFYLAYLLGFLASSLVGGDWGLYATTALMFSVYDLAARSEEVALRRCPGIGSQYATYVERTWRWCPMFW